ncbi:AAA family ATPase [Mycolicibacterium boenickei]
MSEPGEPTSGVMTFLFTDIEGSTRRWEADPDAMRADLAVHDDALRAAIESHGGRVFKHTGDGACAAFTSPKAAVDAAVAAQLRLKLPVRMGIATGEAEVRGDDYFGTVLNRAARVMAAGHGGQMLLDGATAGLLSNVDLVGHGHRRLRDIAKPVELYQVQAAGLSTEFPPLRTEDPAPGNLRVPTTSFIGREAAVSGLVDAVAAHRLVTLIGVGGVGKTRLAHEVGARLANWFRDGVWLIELAAVADPRALPDAVAAALGTMQQPGLTVAQSIADALAGQTRLLIFDNCEHVLDAAAELIDTILTASETVKILATSREGLRAADEQLWPVPSLKTGAGSAAVLLFTDRAQAVAPGVGLDSPGDTSAVVEICQRLDGIPLAIELAASRLQSMTVTEVRDRLDDRFRLLVGSRRGLERHQTLRHAVGWSYDLLSDTERSVLSRCSVFAGGFDLSAACAVAEERDEFTTLDLLDALVRKSLVIADRTASRTRYSMLETIRQFAEDQLAASGEAIAARDAHARYYAERETDVFALWDSPRQRESYEWLTAELANIRAAFRWAADHDDLDTAAPIATYPTVLGNWIEQYEPIAWAEELIAPAQAVDHPRLAQLYTAAAQCYVLARISDAVAYSEAARRAIGSARFDKVAEHFEASLAAPYLADGQPDRAIALCHDIIGRPAGAHVLARTALVMSLLFAAEPEAAMTASHGMLSAASAEHNPHVMQYACLAYGLARIRDDPASARQALQQGLDIARNHSSQQVESHLAVGLARIAVADGELIEAFDLLSSAIHNHYGAGGYSHLNNPLALLAVALQHLGSTESSAVILGHADIPYTRGGLPEITTAIADLRKSLGDERYGLLSGHGAQMSNAAVVSYALEQIDRARADLSQPGEF